MLGLGGNGGGIVYPGVGRRKKSSDRPQKDPKPVRSKARQGRAGDWVKLVTVFQKTSANKCLLETSGSGERDPWSVESVGRDFFGPWLAGRVSSQLHLDQGVCCMLQGGNQRLIID